MFNFWKPQRPLRHRRGRITFSVEYCDITEVPADVLVSSDDNEFTMSGGVSKAIRTAGGEEVYRAAGSHAPASLGAVVITTAGNMRPRTEWIFHCAVMDFRKRDYANRQVVSDVTRECLKKADKLGAQSIAFPALGTGDGRLSFIQSAAGMMDAVVDYFSGGPALDSITIALKRRAGVKNRDLDAFYRQVKARVVDSTDTRRFRDHGGVQ